MKDEIFLSYAREDRERAKIFAEALEKKDYSVWWDRKIPIGWIFDEFIKEKLKEAKCVIVLWSRDSVKSRWVKDEAGRSQDKLIPVLIDDVDTPLGYGMFQTARLIDWKGDLTHPEFDLLLQSVAEMTGTAVKNEVIKPETQPKKPDKIETKAGTIITNSIGMKFTLIPAGTFEMGSNESDDEKPMHKVTIGSRFYLGIYQVTQKEWEAVMGKNPSKFKGDNLPVENVSWKDVQKFIKKLNKKEGTEKYRLPSEAEWEYAARAGTSTRYSFGDNEFELGDYAWYAENSGSRPPKKGNFFGYDQKDWIDNKWNGKTHPIGEKNPNPWGLYDMHGNVWEWVQDKWHDSYDGAPSDGSSWESGYGSARVFRGGSWCSFARFCRSAYRSYNDAGSRYDVLGFRLLRIL